MKDTHTAIVGGGHAGLAISNLLCSKGIDNVVLERGKVAERWRNQRWDSFTLLTPNWATWLPNFHYTGGDPNGFMGRDEVVKYFEAYRDSFDAPVHEGVDVTRLSKDERSFHLETSAGDLRAESVVVATGSFQTPSVPTWAVNIPGDIQKIHSSQYRNPEQLAQGAVIVVGSGASGLQIVEDCLRSKRRVYLCTGSTTPVPRRYRGHDYIWWLEHGGWYEKTVDDVPKDKRYGVVSQSLTGFGGGHDLSIRSLHAQGAILLGRGRSVSGACLQLERNVAKSLADGDKEYNDFVEWVEGQLYRFENAYAEPTVKKELPDPPESPSELDMEKAGVGAIVFATGFKPDYREWIDLSIFDGRGYPEQRRGLTKIKGLYFLGLEWLYRARSPFIRGADEDARHIASLIASSESGGNVVSGLSVARV